MPNRAPGGDLSAKQEVLASLNHPHVVSLIDQGRTSGGAHYIAMPFIDGRERFDTLFDNPHYNQYQLLEILAKIAHAVHACHQAGVLHRDLKPANILIDSYGHPHVLDFGMARSLAGAWTEITRQGCDVGSLLWASPEQLQGNSKGVGPEADVYSLGVMLYQCLSGGRLPHPAQDSLSGTLHRILEGTPIPPSDDSRLNQIVNRSIAKRPSQRFQSALNLAEAIESRRSSFFTVNTLRWLKVFGCVLALSGATVGAVRWNNGRPHVVTTEDAPAMTLLPSFINSVGMKLVRVPAGTFEMGTRPDAPYHGRNETLQTVSISKPFWIATTVTTVAQWQSIMRGAVGHASDKHLSDGHPSDGHPSDGHLWDNTADSKLPIADITQAQIAQFCGLLGEREQKNYRLPTEAEWEYAARAGSRGSFGWTENASKVAWYGANSQNHTHEVQTLAPNGWGLFDMLGNVYELCTNPQPMLVSADSDPAYPIVQTCCLRGGSFSDSAANCTVSRRAPGEMDAHAPNIGFRVVISDP